MKAIAHTITNNRMTFYILASGILFSMVFYMYCINAAVRAAVVRNNAESKISSLQAQLSELEGKYMENVNSLTMQTAAQAGLTDPTEKIFISKISGGQSLSYNTR